MKLNENSIKEIDNYFENLFLKQIKNKNDISEINEKLNEKLNLIGIKFNQNEFGDNEIEKYDAVISKLIIFIASKLNIYIEEIKNEEFNYLAKNLNILNELLSKKTKLLNADYLLEAGLVITKSLGNNEFEVVPVKNPTLEQKINYIKYMEQNDISIKK